MDLLLSPQIISLYIRNITKLNKTDEERFATLIFENRNNKFIINKKLLDYYEDEFDPQSNDFDLFQNELLMVLDSRSVNIRSLEENLTDLLNSTNDKYLNDKDSNDFETYMQLGTSDTNTINNNYSAVLSNVSNLNSKDYIYFMLAAYNPNALTKWSFEFQTDKEIVDFINNLYLLRTHNSIIIFDKNINLSHSLYNKLKNKRLHFHYCTLDHRSFNVVERSNQFNTIKDFFNNCALSVYRAPNRIIHDRRVMFNNIIISFDNDPANINVSEPNWQINVHVCNMIKAQMDRRRHNDFTRDTIT